MFRWLDGPGKAFYDPRPGSTNYLNAYTRDGRLARLSRASESLKSSSEELPSPTGLGGIQDAASQVTTHDGSRSASAELPPERPSDLRPFPLNPTFQSQAVLDEELREEIYQRVQKQGKSVKVVSAELGVEMNRVGAVIRLKTIEKEWLRKVSRQTLHSPVLILHYCFI